MPDLLFELRCEELPPKVLRSAATAMKDALAAALTAAGLPARDTAAMWTPRRIALFAPSIAERTADREDRVKGPRAAVAFDASGAPTKAAEGFARKNGVAAAELVRDGEFVFATVKTPGRAAADVIAEILPALPSKAGWKKTMRWGVTQTFARPIRGVLALFGDAVVPCEIAGIRAGRTTYGHRFLAPAAIELGAADRDAYVESMRAAKVLVDPDERRAAVLAAAKRATPDADVSDADLVEEVTNVVEWPSALLGDFDARFLALPARLLVVVMAHHQRFFPVRAADGALQAHFVAILDRDEESVEPSRRGFERVLVPRLNDAEFFVGEDRKRPLVDRLERLKTVTYHKKLGTLFDKAERLSALARAIAPQVGADPEKAARAGLLAKCDLVTLLVGEFPEIQGYVGTVYALADGEDSEVATALDWQYRHDFEFECGAKPGPVALALMLAENLDVLAGFGSKIALPTGSSDPFGLRRAALTLIDLAERFAPEADLVLGIVVAGLLFRPMGSDVGTDAVPIATRIDALMVDRVPPREFWEKHFPEHFSSAGELRTFVKTSLMWDVVGFLDTRLRQRFRDRGTPPDHLDAIGHWRSVGEFARTVASLAALAKLPEFDRLLEVAERCRNITKKSDAPTAAVRPDLLTEPAERALWEVWQPLRDALPAAPSPLARADVERIAATLAAPLHRFFDEVFVNADDPAVRTNRHSLLREIDAALLRFADLCKIVRKGATPS